jgi:hypothetical protein
VNTKKVKKRSPASRLKRLLKWTGIAFGAFYVLPLAAACCLQLFRGPEVPYYRADRSSIGIAPDPAKTPEAVVEAYTARAYGWRGIFGVHTWIAVKQAGASYWERFEVIGFGVSRGRPAVRVGRGVPDGRWYGNDPIMLSELRGAEAEAVIPRLREAAADYPYQRTYTVWPGPNSNTFTAHLLRRVPALRVDMPVKAIGKDAGIDFTRPALRLPGLGRIGMKKRGHNTYFPRN